MKRPKLRDSYKLQTSEPYPINEIPNNLIEKIGGHLSTCCITIRYAHPSSSVAMTCFLIACSRKKTTATGQVIMFGK